MCDPITIATVALSAASSVASYSGQRQAAKAQERAAADAYEANQSAINVRQSQANERATQQMSERAREAMVQRGRLRAIAADRGGGLVFDRLEGEVNLAESTDMATIERNRSMQEQQGQLDKRGMRAQSQSQINLSQRPSEIGLALNLANAGVKGASKLKIPTDKSYTDGERDYW